MLHRLCLPALFVGMLVLSGGLAGQDKKDDKKTDPPTKLKGKLPQHWTKIGLTETQVQDVYKVQAKYNDEIAKLKAKMKDLEATRDKEERAILTPEQKKRLEELLVGKDKDK